MLIPYPFPLRPDLTITIELPDNLTGQEIDRLQRFIGTLDPQWDAECEEFGCHDNSRP